MKRESEKEVVRIITFELVISERKVTTIALAGSGTGSDRRGIMRRFNGSLTEWMRVVSYEEVYLNSVVLPERKELIQGHEEVTIVIIFINQYQDVQFLERRPAREFVQ